MTPKIITKCWSWCSFKKDKKGYKWKTKHISVHEEKKEVYGKDSAVTISNSTIGQENLSLKKHSNIHHLV